MIQEDWMARSDEPPSPSILAAARQADKPNEFVRQIRICSTAERERRRPRRRPVNVPAKRTPRLPEHLCGPVRPL